MKTTVLIATLVLSSLAPGAAMAADDCNVPMVNWQPRQAVEQMAKAHGWIVRRIKIDDGCYEIRGEDRNGQAIEVKIDPGSLAVIRMKYKHGEDDRGYNDRQDEQLARGGMPALTVARSRDAPVGAGVAPRVQIR